MQISYVGWTLRVSAPTPSPRLQAQLVTPEMLTWHMVRLASECLNDVTTLNRTVGRQRCSKAQRLMNYSTRRHVEKARLTPALTSWLGGPQRHPQNDGAPRLAAATWKASRLNAPDPQPQQGQANRWFWQLGTSGNTWESSTCAMLTKFI